MHAGKRIWVDYAAVLNWLVSTCHGSGILFDTPRSVLCGSFVGTVELTHRHPVVFGKNARHPENMLAAPVWSQDDRSAQMQKINRIREPRE
jgi:hypothetical protein